MKDLLKIIVLSNALISIGFGNCDSDEVELWDECYSITNTTSLLRINEGLTGEIPSEIGQLTNLVTLKLQYNELTGSIPTELLESELFGHEKGSFTGAFSQRIGRFEQAENGSLFLDEIGDMPLDAQTRLLRVLQEGEFTSVGGRKAVKADVRIIAATHRDLKSLIEKGQFREDLYYRLNVVPLRLPPLRERKEDIRDLVLHFLESVFH